VKFVVPAVTVSLAVACLACSGGGDKIVAAPMPVPQTVQPAPVSDFPALTHSGTIYGQQGDLYAVYASRQGSMTSRYVLYDDGSFELQFVSGARGFFSYAGTYTRSGGDLTLNFSDRDTAGAWTGTAALSGDQMSVKYNVIMMGADFVDGVYKKES
jgi:hypothetical protein